MAWYDWYTVLVLRAILNQHAIRLDVKLDDRRGRVLFQVWAGLNLGGESAPRVPGGLVTLDPVAKKLFGDVLWLAASSLTQAGVSGAGGVLNLAPGTVMLSATAPAGTCLEHDFHFLADEGVPVPIPAGSATAIDPICPAE